MNRPRMIRVCAFAAAASAVLVASSAVGQQETAPGPANAQATTYAPAAPMPSGAERMRLRDGLAAAESGDWGGLASLRDSSTDPLVRRMLQWRWASSNEAPLYFADIKQALDELQRWPGRNIMRTRAEQAIFDSRQIRKSVV